MPVKRNWLCLNARCAAEFEAWEDYPACPTCQCVRVQWIPGGGHVAGTARAADAELRTLADNYGLSDLVSAKRGERAKPAVRQHAVTGGREAAVQFAPGFAAVPYARDSQGHAHAVCQPSMQNVNFKTKLGAGLPLGPGKLGHKSIATNTRIEGSHRGRP